jgi:hypothetical protein
VRTYLCRFISILGRQAGNETSAMRAKLFAQSLVS